MRAIRVLMFCGILATNSAFMIKTPVLKPAATIGYFESEWVPLQKLILPLFEDVCETSTDPIVVRLANEFNLDTIGPNFKNPSVINDLKTLKAGKGFLPKGRIFTEYDAEHLNELKIIYEALYNAKDFDTFFKTSAWFRQNVNCGVFVDAIYTAMLKRKDTQHLAVPAPYELLPNYFLRKDVITKAVNIISNEVNDVPDGVRNEGSSYIVDANYTSDYYDNEDESVLAYFNEDIGLNAYHYLKILKNAPWFNEPTNVDNKYGENLYFTLKQFAARYDLERYSNGLPNVEIIDWSNLRTVPYDPMLLYSNGDNFGIRKYNADPADDVDTALLKDIENNISTYVAHVVKYVQDKSTYNKAQILNHLVEILVTKENSYDDIARRVLSKSIGKLSSLDHFMTSLRDPMFWRLNKKLVYLIDRSLQVLPKYTKTQIYFPGVEILNVDVKKMTTMCDKFEFDITDALKLNTTKNTFQVRIEQPRLNHKPFTIKLTVSSLVRRKGLVKIFLGPKTLPGEFSQSKDSFMLLDSFETNFKLGSNVISRSSSEITYLSNDFESLKTLRKKVVDAEFGLDVAPTSIVRELLGFPSRLVIPKGSVEGLPFQLFVFISPYVTPSGNSLYPQFDTNLNMDTVFSPGYPLDLGIEDTDLVELPNAFIKDVLITHKAENKGYNPSDSETNQWSRPEDSYGSSYKSERTFGQKGSFDYKSKKGQYDYKSKKSQYDKKDYSYKRDVVTENSSKLVEVPQVDVTVEKTFDSQNNSSVYKNVDNTDTENFNPEKILPNLISKPGIEQGAVKIFKTPDASADSEGNKQSGKINYNKISPHPLLTSKKYDAKSKFGTPIEKFKEQDVKIEKQKDHIINDKVDADYKKTVETKKDQLDDNNSKINVKSKVDKVVSKSFNVDKQFNKNKKTQDVSSEETISDYNYGSAKITKKLDPKTTVTVKFNDADRSVDSKENLRKDIMRTITKDFSKKYITDSDKSLTVKPDDDGTVTFTQEDFADLLNDEADVIDNNRFNDDDKTNAKRCLTVYDFVIGNCWVYPEKVYE